jgi:hypothetical protein
VNVLNATEHLFWSVVSCQSSVGLWSLFFVFVSVFVLWSWFSLWSLVFGPWSLKSGI